MSNNPANLRNISDVILLQIPLHAVDHIQRQGGVHKGACPNLHHGGPRHNELNGVLPGGNSPQAHHRDGHRVGHLVHHPQGDGLDGRAGQTGVYVVKDRFAPLQVDGHGLKGVGEGDAVGPLLLAGLGQGGNILRVGGEFYHQLVPADGPHLPHKLPGDVRLKAEAHTAVLCIGAGDVQLQKVQRVVVEQRHPLQVVLLAVAAQIDNIHQIQPVDPLQVPLNKAADPGILHPHAVEHTAGCLPHPDAVVPRAGVQGQPLGAQAAQPLNVKVLIELPAEAAGPRGQGHRIFKGHTGENRL